MGIDIYAPGSLIDVESAMGACQRQGQRRVGSHKAKFDAQGDLRRTVTEMVSFFCRSFDRDWVLFSYLLLSQHRHLCQRPPDRPNPPSVLKAAIVEAMARGEIPERDPDLLTSMVMGMVLQPAVSRVYDRLGGKLSDHEEALSAACWRVLGKM